jgi:hypothetical protein
MIGTTQSAGEDHGDDVAEGDAADDEHGQKHRTPDETGAEVLLDDHARRNGGQDAADDDAQPGMPEDAPDARQLPEDDGQHDDARHDGKLGGLHATAPPSPPSFVALDLDAEDLQVNEPGDARQIERPCRPSGSICSRSRPRR